MSIPPAPLDAFAESVIEHAVRELDHEERFEAAPGFLSRRARLTQALTLLNLVMFAVEFRLGGATNLETLYRLGALLPPAVRAGEWWRLAASLFLHVGGLHLAMNMVALWVLGPFVEFALGRWKFLLVYLLTGTGSMGVVMAFASGPTGQQMTVGASGCIMGLVGATGALMLRGWLKEKAISAGRRLALMFAIVAMQTTFDAFVPQVSMAAHLAGAAIGFGATMLLRDRLAMPSGTQSVPQPQQPVAETPPRG
jgi:rhomboid protease GluP